MQKTPELKEARFELGDLLGIGMTIVVLVIGLSYGAEVTSDVKEDTITNTWNCGLNATNGTGAGKLYNGCDVDYNITQNGLTGLDELGVKIPTIVKVIVAAVIIGILVRYLWARFSS